MHKLLIAVVGLPGAGKTALTKYLMRKLKAPKVWFGQVTNDEMTRRRIEHNQANERLVRESLREELGLAAYAIKSEAKIKKYLETYDKVIIESLYSWEEYLYLRKKFDVILIHIYAPPKIRYARIVGRHIRGLEHEKEARERDFAQLTYLNQGGPIAIADYLVNNTGTIKDAFRQIDKIITEINHK